MKVPVPAPSSVRAPCPPERAFRFEDGSTARSLDELAARLASASPSTVQHHKDHFAPWLRDVVGDAPLAARFEAYAGSGAEAGALRDLLAGLVRARLAELAPPEA